MPKPWPVIHSHRGPVYSVFTLRTDTVQAPHTGKQHEFYVIESPDWVNIIPVTEDKQVIMVRQFRHGTRSVTLEVPGGMVEPGDSPIQAAARELLEETGDQAGNLLQLGVIDPNPAILTNRCTTFLARNLTLTGTGVCDETEDIEVVRVPLSRIPSLIKDGTITNALIVVAFWWFFSMDGDIG